MSEAYQPNRCLARCTVRSALRAGFVKEGSVMSASKNISNGLRTFVSDVASGLFEVTHNGFAMLGVVVAFTTLMLTVRPEIREMGETQLINWLQARHISLGMMEAPPEIAGRATAADPRDLPKQQAKVAYWLSKKYRVAPEPLSALVAEAYDIGARTKLDPTLILAIMAVESGFNPFAQSAMGAQGLMQVMTKVHGDKYDNFGGRFAAFDPVANLRVGVKVLQECIARAGSLEGGLRHYVGAANLDSDGGYASKVLAEHARLQAVASGRPVPAAPPAMTTTDGTADAEPEKIATLLKF